MKLDDLLAEIEAHTDADALSLVGCLKFLEDTLFVFVGDAFALVNDFDLDGFSSTSESDGDVRAFGRKLLGVAEKVVNDLANFRLVDLSGRDFFQCIVEAQGDGFGFGDILKLFADFLEEGSDVGFDEMEAGFFKVILLHVEKISGELFEFVE